MWVKDSDISVSPSGGHPGEEHRTLFSCCVCDGEKREGERVLPQVLSFMFSLILWFISHRMETNVHPMGLLWLITGPGSWKHPSTQLVLKVFFAHSHIWAEKTSIWLPASPQFHSLVRAIAASIYQAPTTFQALGSFFLCITLSTPNPETRTIGLSLSCWCKNRGSETLTDLLKNKWSELKPGSAPHFNNLFPPHAGSALNPHSPFLLGEVKKREPVLLSSEVFLFCFVFFE